MNTTPKEKHYDPVEALWWQMHAETSSTSTIALVACTLALLLVIIGMLIFMYLLGVRTLQERAQAAMHDHAEQDRTEPLPDLEDIETLLDAPPSYDDVMRLLIGPPKPPPYDTKSKPVQRSQAPAKRLEQRIIRKPEKPERRHKVRVQTSSQPTSTGSRTTRISSENSRNNHVLSFQERHRPIPIQTPKGAITDNISNMKSQLSISEPNLLMFFTPEELPATKAMVMEPTSSVISVRPKNTLPVQKTTSLKPILPEKKTQSNPGLKVKPKPHPGHVVVSFCDCEGACACPQTRVQNDGDFLGKLWQTRNTKGTPPAACPACLTVPKFPELVAPIHHSNSAPNFPAGSRRLFVTYLSHDNLRFQ